MLRVVSSSEPTVQIEATANTTQLSSTLLSAQTEPEEESEVGSKTLTERLKKVNGVKSKAIGSTLTIDPASIYNRELLISLCVRTIGGFAERMNHRDNGISATRTLLGCTGPNILY